MKRTLGGDVRRPGSRPARFALADQIAATFPRRGDRFDLYAFGPATDLLGKPLAQLRVGDPVRTRVVLRHPEVLADVDPSGRVVPVYATGTVRGAAAPATVALVLNGAVAATGATFGDKASFSLLFPPSLLRPGSNDARLYLVTRDAAGALLHPAA
jgi:hypothetical protein